MRTGTAATPAQPMAVQPTAAQPIDVSPLQIDTLPGATALPEIPAAPSPVLGQDAVTLSTRAQDKHAAPSFNLPGLATGQRLKVEGKYKGHGFGGKADITHFDGQKLDVTVNASAFVFIKVKVRMKFEAQPDGSVMFLAERLGGEKKDGEPSKIGTRLQVVSQQAGLTIFQEPSGGQIRMQALPKGGLSISYDQYAITLKP